MTLTTRPVTTDDLELICDQRERMFRESKTPGRTEEILSTQTAHFRSWLAPRLRDGSYFGHVVEEAGKPVAGIGLMLIDWPPGPSHPTSDKRGYVLNVFVERSHRRKGLAATLMELADRRANGRVVSVLEGGYDLEGLAKSVAAHVTALMRG